jgi:hypothetical protein
MLGLLDWVYDTFGRKNEPKGVDNLLGETALLAHGQPLNDVG